MKNKLLLLSLILIVAPFSLVAQNIQSDEILINEDEILQKECGSRALTIEEKENLPWWNNEGFFDTFNDTFPYSNSNLRSKNTQLFSPQTFIIPVKFWINDRNPIGEWELDWKQTMIDGLNEAFQSNDMSVFFYAKCVVELNNPNLQDIDYSTGARNDANSAYSQLTNNYDTDAINVYIVDEVDDLSTPLDDAVAVVIRADDLIIIDRGAVEVIGTYVHEFGHFFGLQHTHNDEGLCGDEYVNRGWFWRSCPPFYNKWCRGSGDGFCDTPADPRMLNDFNDVSGFCAYTGNATDGAGQTYTPDVNNYMAVGNRMNCRSNFSPQQGIGMTYNLSNRSATTPYYHWIPQRLPTSLRESIYVDKFEPDNIDRNARRIDVGEEQGHTFHTINCNDEEDWLLIDLSKGVLGGHKLTLKPYSTFNFPLTTSTVSIYNANQLGASGRYAEQGQLAGTTITQSGSEIVVNIPCNVNLTHNSFALVKIEKTSPTTFGRYVAKLEYSTPQPSFINSTGAACNGTIVSDLNKVPRGATVTYNTSSNISLVGNMAGDIVISNVSSGTEYWVDALITYNGCTVTIRKELTPPISLSLNPIQVTASSTPNIYYLSVTPVAGGTYSWTASSGGTIQSNGNTATVTINPNTTCAVTLTVTDDCGGTVTLHRIITNFGRPAINIVSITPNPTDNFTTVSLNKENTTELVYLTVTNQYGKVMLNRKTNETSINLNTYQLPIGVYYIKIVSDSGTDTKTLLIQR